MSASLLRRIGVLVGIALLAVWLFFPLNPIAEEPLRYLIDTAVTRGLCAFVFLLTLAERESPVLRPFVPHTAPPSVPWRAHPIKTALLCLPWLAIAINNLPILPLLSGEACVTGSLGEILLLALGCLFIGLFEEAAFRGLVFLSALKRLGSKPLGIFLSIVCTSGIFGLIHLVNLFEGASPGAVVMQVGYSFLIGGMCAIAMLKTGSVWVPVLLHALYDFNGYLVPYLGTGTIWTTAEIALTAIVAVLVGIYTLPVLFSIRPEEAEACLEDGVAKQTGKRPSAQNDAETNE